MSKIWIFILLAILASSAHFLSPSAKSEEALPTKPVLILYDSQDNDPNAKMGYAFAIMVRNLLGHFDLDADLHPAVQYSTGEIEGYQSIFYLGSQYDNPLPAAFLSDVIKTEKRVTWFKYNLWQLTAQNPDFASRFGFSFQDLAGLNATPTASAPKPGFYDTVLYKNQAMTKYYQYDATINRVNADPDVGVVNVQTGSAAKVHAWIQNSITGKQLPYVVQGGPKRNFWYFADLPLTFIGPRDRYLVLCDLLHDILGVNHPEDHPAMVRLEDVGARTNTNSIKRLVDLMKSKNIPFSVAAIPSYRDPLGAGTGGTPEKIPLANAPGLQRSLKYAIENGGSIVMHGYTHQYGSQPNPNTGISADDYEFWDAVHNTPVREDSLDWALGRLDAGLTQLNQANLAPFAWETPHYQASPESYRAFAMRFATTYQRVVYYTSPKPNLDLNAAKRDFWAGMFFPYIISRDFYGQRVLPENLGNIEYDIRDVDPTSNYNYSYQDILTNAQYGLVVRDGFASFFFHPFWVDPGFERLHAYEHFNLLLDGLTGLGYHWVSPTTFKPLR